MNKINVLVTGAGSGVGQSIIRSLLLSKIKLNIMIADIDATNPFPIFNYKYVKIPKVENTGSKNKIKKILLKLKINKVFVVSEF